MNCLKCNKELSKRQKLYCSNQCKMTDVDAIKKRGIKKNKNPKDLIAICKIDGKIFSDVKNYSGVLSKHLIKLGIVEFNNVFDYYIIEKNTIAEKQYWNCKYCDWKTTDIKNKSGCITTHIKKHGVDITTHIEKHPEDESVWLGTTSKDFRTHIFSKNNDCFIHCLECNNKFRRITKTHLLLHDMTMEQYREKYSIQKLSSVEVINSMKENYLKNSDSINKIKKTSKYENEIKEFLQTNGFEVEQSNRQIIFPKELDLYLPKENVAIEIHGLYWHSEISGKKHKNYHLEKFNYCNDKGIRLIQIFEDEWRSKKEIVKSKILSILNKNTKSIYARNCVVKEIDSKQKSDFLNNYHIQGDDRSNIKYGLFYFGELVAVMTFSGLRSSLGQKKQTGHYELVRFCSKYRVIGGGSKLFCYFLNNNDVKIVISYADKRYSVDNNNNLYKKLGFTLQSESKPNYWYTKDYIKRHHRYTYNKKRLVDKFGGDSKKTEFEISQSLGFDRIWDCGNFKYIYVV